MSFAVKAVVFDWAGTMVDFGCMAPVEALIEVFKAEGVEISDAEARRDMGKAKHDHLTAIMANPAVASRWRETNGATVAPADIERIYQALVPAMTVAAARASLLIPGAAETAAALVALGVRIGSGTGYTREMMAEYSGQCGAAGLCTGSGGLRGRDAQRPAGAVDDLESPDRVGRLAGARLHQGGRCRRRY